MNRLIIFSLSLLLISACSGSKYSVTKGKPIAQAAPVEDPQLLYKAGYLQEQKIKDFPDKDDPTRSAALIGQAISLAITAANQVIAAEQKKYTVEYRRKVDHIYFYDQVSNKGVFDPTGMQFDGFEIINEVMLGKGKNKYKDTAMHMSFEVDIDNPYTIINNSVFHLKLKEIEFNYTNAKMAKTRWYNPLSWGQKNLDELLNVDVELVLKTTYVTQDGRMLKDEVIGTFLFPIRNMPMNPEHPNYQKFREDLIGRHMQGFSFLIPRSIGHRIAEKGLLEQIYSQGRFSMEIRVRESGRDKFVERTFYENSGSMFKSLEKSAKDVVPRLLEAR
jgi:hypothetical protein